MIEIKRSMRGHSVNITPEHKGWYFYPIDRALGGRPLGGLVRYYVGTSPYTFPYRNRESKRVPKKVLELLGFSLFYTLRSPEGFSYILCVYMYVGWVFPPKLLP